MTAIGFGSLACPILEFMFLILVVDRVGCVVVGLFVCMVFLAFYVVDD